MDEFPLIRKEGRSQDVDLRMVPLGFFTLISIGTFLLVLPITQRDGQYAGFIDAFFLSVSATCVTGLSTVNVGQIFNEWGQGVILFLIQAGGLGIFTASLTLALLSGSRLSLIDEQLIAATVGKLQQARPFDIFVYALLLVFVCEMAGAVSMFFVLTAIHPGDAPGTLLWQAVFHAISAFCNAGISIFPEGLVYWRNNMLLLGIICALVIAGGIGLMTLVNMRYFYFWRRDALKRGRLTLQTKVCIRTSVILLLIGTLVTLLFEWNHTFQDVPWWKSICWAFFHSSMTRTAGFNVVDLGEMNPITLFASVFLMFIGGSPGSMAGGIKTVTFALIVATVFSALKRHEDVQIGKRTINPRLCNVAVMLAFIAAIIVTIGVSFLMVSEQGNLRLQSPQKWLNIVFEAVSAFGTVGLSTGITPLLSDWGKFIVAGLMFIGRVGPLMIAVYLCKPAKVRRVRFPAEDLTLG